MHNYTQVKLMVALKLSPIHGSRYTNTGMGKKQQIYIFLLEDGDTLGWVVGS